MNMSLEEIKRAVASLDGKEQAELMAYVLHLRYGEDADYRREVTDRLNDKDNSHWFTPDEFKRRLEKN